MKLLIEQEPMVVVKMDLHAVGKEVRNSLNIEKAVKDNIRIIENHYEQATSDHIHSGIWLSLDWGKLLDAYFKYKKGEMTINIYNIKATDVPLITPETVDETDGELDFEVELKTGETVIVMQDLIAHHQFHIHQWMAQHVYEFAGRKFIPLMTTK